MAKVKGPLLSLDARGKIADTIVFSNWKGIKTARTYIIPANPNTADQQTQRGLLSSAVTAYRNADLTGADKLAWDLLATTSPTPMFGFNRWVKNYIDLIIAEKTYNAMVAFEADTDTPEEITFSVDATAEDLAITLYYGTSPTSLINSAAMAHSSGGVYTKKVENLSPGVKYYATAIVTTEAKAGNRTGILSAECT